jgi:hypothetical protein
VARWLPGAQDEIRAEAHGTALLKARTLLPERTLQPSTKQEGGYPASPSERQAVRGGSQQAPAGALEETDDGSYIDPYG